MGLPRRDAGQGAKAGWNEPQDAAMWKPNPLFSKKPSARTVFLLGENILIKSSALSFKFVE